MPPGEMDTTMTKEEGMEPTISGAETGASVWSRLIRTQNAEVTMDQLAEHVREAEVFRIDTAPIGRLDGLYAERMEGATRHAREELLQRVTLGPGAPARLHLTLAVSIAAVLLVVVAISPTSAEATGAKNSVLTIVLLLAAMGALLLLMLWCIGVGLLRLAVAVLRDQRIGYLLVQALPTKLEQAGHREEASHLRDFLETDRGKKLTTRKPTRVRLTTWINRLRPF